MARGSLRRSNLIAPFGPGSITTLVDGTAVILPGTDTWYLKDGISSPPLESVVRDQRLEDFLHVAKFVLPPVGSGHNQDGILLDLPVARFPRWSFCVFCKRLHESPITRVERVQCGECPKAKGKFKPSTVQVPFVVVCASGHIDDFPWREWVHKSVIGGCAGSELRLTSTGAGDLSGQVVECTRCNKFRSLRGVTEWSQGDSGIESKLSKQLDASDIPYLCGGARPWLFEGPTDAGCTESPVALLRSASNVHFARVESAIYIPPKGDVDSALMEMLSAPTVEPIIDHLVQEGQPVAAAARKRLAGGQLDRWSDGQIEVAAVALFGHAVEPAQSEPLMGSPDSLDRIPEWSLLRSQAEETDLIVRLPRYRSAPQPCRIRRARKRFSREGRLSCIRLRRRGC